MQAKLNVEKGLQTEVEHLREASKQLESRLEDKNIEDEEKWTKREEIWKAKLSEADIALQAVEAREKILQERLEVTEKQLQEASEAMNQSVGGQSLSSEFAELHSQHVDLIKEKQALEVEVTRHKAEAAEAVARQQAAVARVELLQRELEEAQCSLSSYARAVEAAKMDAMELQAQLDAVTMDNLNEDGKGNSLFSEVNDRRERVENQLKVYEEKYEMLKNNYDVKMAELQKTKMHNAKLLSIAGSSHSDTGHTARLEELLASERTKNKSLRDRLDTLEKLSAKTEPLAVPVTHGAVMDSSSNETVMVPHTQSEEYSYLSSLLTNTQGSNKELKKQPHLNKDTMTGYPAEQQTEPPSEGFVKLTLEKKKIEEILLNVGSQVRVDWASSQQKTKKVLKPKRMNCNKGIVKTKKGRYSMEDICVATTLLYGSKRNYNYIRNNKLMDLPCIRLVYKRLEKFTCPPGKSPQVMRLLELKMKTLDKDERNVTLSFDEIYLEQKFSFCPRLRQGFPAVKVKLNSTSS